MTDHEHEDSHWWSVAIYECNLAYGGPEEGGWWYDCGQVYIDREAPPIIVSKREDIPAAREKLREYIKTAELNKGRYDTSSVLCNGYYEVRVFENELPTYFPKERPHYE